MYQTATILWMALAAIAISLLGTILHSGFCLLRNYLTARRIGVPIQVILFDHVSPL